MNTDWPHHRANVPINAAGVFVGGLDEIVAVLDIPPKYDMFWNDCNGGWEFSYANVNENVFT